MRGVCYLTILLTLLFASAACVRGTVGTSGDDVRGAAVQKVIDEKIAPYLKSQDPRLKIEPAKCPARIDVSDGKVGHCSLSVNRVDLPVRVVYYGEDPQSFKANLEGSFFETALINQYVEKSLKLKYGLTTTAHCPGATVQLLKAGTIFSCNIAGSNRITSVRVKAMANGMLFYYTPAPLLSPRPG